MSIKFSSWNVEARLTRTNNRGRGSDMHIVDEIRALDADVIVLPEAYESDIGVDPYIEAELSSMGYESIDTTYNDKGGEREFSATNEPVMRIMSRLAIEHHRVVRLGDIRNMLNIHVRDPQTGTLVSVYGIHLDDRNSDLRIRQIVDIPRFMDDDPHLKAMAGDFNSSTGEHPHEKFLNSGFMRRMAQAVPGPLLRDVAIRATMMNSGNELRLVEDLTKMRNLNERGRPTVTPKQKGLEFLPAVRLMSIDHMFVDQAISADDFRVMKRDGGSDHRAISATLSINPVKIAPDKK